MLCVQILFVDFSPDYIYAVFGMDDLAFGTLASGIIGGIGSIFGSSSSNATQEEIAAQNRDWQSRENQMNRDWQSGENRLSENWQEKMWNANNQYNSPSAQMARNKEAGYNPFLLGSQSPASSSQMAGTPAKGSPSMVGSPNMPNIQPVDYGAPFNNAVSALLNAKGVDANSANQRAQSVKSIVEAATDAFKSMGYKGFKAVLQYAAPFLGDSSPDGSFVERQAFYTLQKMQLDNAEKQILVDLQGKYSEQQILTAIEKTNYDISEIVGRLNSMRINNEATIKRLAYDALVSAAHAFKLRQEGGKYAADAKTVNAIREFVVNSARANSILSGNAASLSSASLSGEKALIPLRQGAEWNNLDVHGNRNLIFLDYVTDQIGDVFNVGLYHGSGNYTNSGSVLYGQKPFVEASWDARNPLGGTTHYRQRK